jgi:hypothetical protein
MAAFLESVKSLYRDLAFPYPIALFIKSSNHANTLTYNIETDTWYIIDGNWIGDRTYGQGVANAAKLLISCFSASDTAVFDITFLTCKNYLNDISMKFNVWYSQLSDDFKIDNMQTTGRDSYDTTLLYLATENNLTDFALTLLAAGADPAMPSAGTTPLHRAVYHNNLTLTKALVDHKGTDINQPILETGETALIIAAKLGRNETVDLLLSRGANTKLRDHEHKTALQHAANDHIKQALRPPAVMTIKPFLGTRTLRPANTSRITLFSERFTSITTKEEPRKKKMRCGNDNI